MDIVHIPVLLKEVLELLDPKPGGVYVDATIGLGGHSENIVKFIDHGGLLIGIDRDDESLKMAEKRISDTRVRLKMGKFSDIESLLDSDGIHEVDGIFFDLGISMAQFKDYERGFSFVSDKRLDMRMDRKQMVSAWDVVNRYPEENIERILREFGEEWLSRKIAKEIIRRRSKKAIDTCADLSGIVESVYRRRGALHPATKTFQALRIEVNNELDELRSGLESSLRLLKKGGRLCVISYHSLEDRIVKRFIVDSSRRGLIRMITKKPITPSPEEVRSNPSSRSAKLRASERI
ncbi:MAG: 16S rRNA (cytosine(1402)-N(4))-methyltransferase RsmH [Nitrospirota bacterium]|nr:16S rRNA (cytosine(1402)-N(4))-methyltransferase RsmH [Nitrospirota bacterium]